MSQGDETIFVSSLRADCRYGIYTSPEQKPEKGFDSVVLNVDATVPEDSMLSVEFRSKSEEDAWSEWRELSMVQLNELVLTDLPSKSMQYRVTFYASNPAASP